MMTFFNLRQKKEKDWIPAFAGMAGEVPSQEWREKCLRGNGGRSAFAGIARQGCALGHIFNQSILRNWELGIRVVHLYSAIPAKAGIQYPGTRRHNTSKSAPPPKMDSLFPGRTKTPKMPAIPAKAGIQHPGTRRHNTSKSAPPPKMDSLFPGRTKTPKMPAIPAKAGIQHPGTRRHNTSNLHRRNWELLIVN